jgi:glycosyltransferase involved in cell wall biosynthesis
MIELLPRLSPEAKSRLIAGARFLVWPSLGEYETFGLVVAEAYACGVPVVASRTGVAEEMVGESRTGLFFAPSDAADLARQALWAWQHPSEMMAMGANGHKLYESKFTFDHAYRRMMDVYCRVAPQQKLPEMTAVQ